jgi:hypothetical protein
MSKVIGILALLCAGIVNARGNCEWQPARLKWWCSNQQRIWEIRRSAGHGIGHGQLKIDLLRRKLRRLDPALSDPSCQRSRIETQAALETEVTVVRPQRPVLQN